MTTERGGCGSKGVKDMVSEAEAGPEHLEAAQGLVQRVSVLESELQELRKEKDELEDLLVQEQLKGKMPQNSNCISSFNRTSSLELELEAMASKCEEWRRRAKQKAKEAFSPEELQGLLGELLEDMDDTGIVALKAEVDRLRAELAHSEVQRLELYKKAQNSAAAAAASPQWERQEEGLEQQALELDIDQEVVMGENSATGDPVEWGTLGQGPDAKKTQAGLAEEAADEHELVSQLLELGEASLISPFRGPDKNLQASLEGAEARAVKAEVLAQSLEVRVRELEARLAESHRKEECGSGDAAAGAGSWSPATAGMDVVGNGEVESVLRTGGVGEEMGGASPGGGDVISTQALAGKQQQQQQMSLCPSLPEAEPPVNGTGPMVLVNGRNLAHLGSGDGVACDSEVLDVPRGISDQASGKSPKESKDMLSRRESTVKEAEVKDLLEQVQAQNRQTHRMLVAVLILPILFRGCCLLVKMLTRQKQSPTQAINNSPLAVQSKSKSAGRRDVPMLVQISARDTGKRGAGSDAEASKFLL